MKLHMYICTEYKKSYLYKTTSRNFIGNQPECSIEEQVSLITSHMTLNNVHCSPLLVASPSFALTQ